MRRTLLRNGSLLLHNYNEFQFNNHHSWRKFTKLILRRTITSPTTSSTKNKKNNHILFVSPTLWPEPDATAAGVRTASLLQHFASPNHDLFQAIHYGCGLTGPPPHLFPHVQMHYLPPNRSSKLKQFMQASHC